VHDEEVRQDKSLVTNGAWRVEHKTPFRLPKKAKLQDLTTFDRPVLRRAITRITNHESRIVKAVNHEARKS